MNIGDRSSHRLSKHGAQTVSRAPCTFRHASSGLRVRPPNHSYSSKSCLRHDHLLQFLTRSRPLFFFFLLSHPRCMSHDQRSKQPHYVSGLRCKTAYHSGNNSLTARIGRQISEWFGPRELQHLLWIIFDPTQALRNDNQQKAMGLGGN